MIFLSKQNIIAINKATIEAHGGNFMPPNNLLHPENLDYVVEIVHAELFGQPLYPSITDKAAIYFYNIICNHIFSDGNKRTGLAAAMIFLNINGYEFDKKHPEKIVYDFTIKVAAGESSIEDCQAWFAEYAVLTA
jgi:death on curing protein